MAKINYRIWEKLSEKQKEKIFSRSEINISEIRETVEKIIDRVRKYKDKPCGNMPSSLTRQTCQNSR